MDTSITPSPDGRPRKAFGWKLRGARTRAGLSVHALAAITRVSASTFAALEEGDISRWPRGIYRRSFFRQYVEAVGLPLDETMAEYERLFADELLPEVPLPQVPEPIAAPHAGHAAIAVLLAAVEWLTRKLSIA